ncbi:tannase and feruloyl esterase [Xylariaceae sp. FL0662B]|nr:tannase and feruloyl esterase [Xylariaceae sp. FL0662B]
MAWIHHYILLLACYLLQNADSATFQESCVKLAATLCIPNTHVQLTQYVKAGTNLSIPDYPQECVLGIGAAPYQVAPADLCRVALRIDTSAQSEMTLEAWLPVNWTGRFLSGGNGGFTGCIQYPDLAYGAMLGFATVSGNNGHNGTTAEPFYKAPEVLEDYVYRAIYTGATVGKQVVKSFYGKQPTKAYFMGCSGGGRQAFKFAQDFPDVFDGLVAGSPAIDFVNLINWASWLSTLAGFDRNSPDFIDEKLWGVIHQETLRQCDGLDGAMDGIIEDPALCYPVFETLICKPSQDTSTCLNGKQAARVREIYEPLYGNNGTLLYPRQLPGADATAFANYLNGTAMFLSQWFQYVVYDPSFDPRNVNRADFAFANEQDPFGVSTWKPDLSAFKRRGGKILALHGLEDGIISSEISKLYYHRVADTMQASPSALDEWYRFFRISGLGHCAGGKGASSIGMYYFGPLTSLSPQDNVLTGVVDWVENGRAPEFVRGTRFKDGSPALGIEYKRKHCKYPARNVYVGPQNYTDENAWMCV